MAWTNRKNIPVTRGQSKGTAGHAPAGHRPDRKVSLAMGAITDKVVTKFGSSASGSQVKGT